MVTCGTWQERALQEESWTSLPHIYLKWLCSETMLGAGFKPGWPHTKPSPFLLCCHIAFSFPWVTLALSRAGQGGSMFSWPFFSFPCQEKATCAFGEVNGTSFDPWLEGTRGVLLIYSLTHSFIYPFTHFLHLLIPLFIYSFITSFTICPSLIPSFTHSFLHLFLYSFILSLTHSLLQQ